MIDDLDRLRIACKIVQKERQNSEVIELEHTVPIHGITLTKLLTAVTQINAVYHKRKKERKKPDFEEIVEDHVLQIFKSEEACAIAKHILCHFFTWRRHKALSKRAHTIALEMELILL